VVSTARFLAALKRAGRVCLDSSVLIYHLEDVRPYADLTEAAFAAIGEAAPDAVLSTLSVTELLVQPYAAKQPERVAAVEHFLLSLANTMLVPPSYSIAKEAARLRAGYGLRTPDALLVATALVEKARGFVTNDSRLRRLKAEGLAILVLEDYC
jgi:predicted nucleic acid-binding protein